MVLASSKDGGENILLTLIYSFVMISYRNKDSGKKEENTAQSFCVKQNSLERCGKIFLHAYLVSSGLDQYL